MWPNTLEPNILGFGLVIIGLYIALALLLKQATKDIGKEMEVSHLKSEYVEFMVEIQPGHRTTCRQMLSKVTSQYEPKGRFEFTYADALKFLEFLDEKIKMPSVVPGHLVAQAKIDEKKNDKLDVESNPVLVE